MRIGILQTDQVSERFRGRHGDYPGMFEALLRAAADGTSLDFDTIDAVRSTYPSATSCDAYIITGSRKGVYDNEPWIAALAAFADRALEAGRKVVGICFGHQLMAHFFGGEAGPASGWAVGVHASRVLVDVPWLDPRLDRFALLSSHRDQVKRLPKGAEPFASNGFCPIAGFTWADKVLTFQGHPEFHKPYAQDLMDMRRELLGEATYQAGVASLAQETHSATVGRWILNFCRAA